MNGRVHVLESRWLALWLIDCKIGIEPYFDLVLSSDADHGVPHTQNSIEPEQVLEAQQTWSQNDNGIVELLRREVAQAIRDPFSNDYDVGSAAAIEATSG